LALLKRSDRTLNEVARDLGVLPSTLRYWYNAAMAKKGKKKKTSGSATAPVRDRATERSEEKAVRLEAENAVLRKRVDELEMDRAILKKAAAFFVKESE
jgi:transposase